MAQTLETHALNKLKTDVRYVAHKKFGNDKTKKLQWLKYILDNNPRGFKKLEMRAIEEVWRELNGKEAKR